SPSRTTLGRLIDEKRVLLLSGSRIAAQDIAAEGHHAVLGGPELSGEGRIGARRIDRVGLATKYEPARFTEPGDLVVTPAPRLCRPGGRTRLLHRRLPRPCPAAESPSGKAAAHSPRARRPPPVGPRYRASPQRRPRRAKHSRLRPARARRRRDPALRRAACR